MGLQLEFTGLGATPKTVQAFSGRYKSRLIRLLTGWSLVRIRPGEPNLTFGKIMLSIERCLRRGGGGFCQRIKRLAQDRTQLSALPRAVRNQKIEQTPLFSRFLVFEQSLRIPRQFENPHPFFEIGLVGSLVLFDRALAAILLPTPFARHPLEKEAVDLPIELVQVHGVDAVLKPVVFGP
jgi:hypothetical protein